MIFAVNLPIGFFIADVSNIWVNELSEVYNITCYNISNVVSWEWINRITQLEKTEQKKGVLGRPMYDEEFLAKKQMIFDFSNSKGKLNNKHKNNTYSSTSSNIDTNNSINPRHTIHSINDDSDDENGLLLGKSISDKNSMKSSKKKKSCNNNSDIKNNKNHLSKKKKYIVRNSEGGAIIYSNELDKNDKSMKIFNKLAKPIINYTDAIIKYGLSIPRSVSHSSNHNNDNDNNNNSKSVSPWGGYGFFPNSQKNKINLNNSNNNIRNINNNNNNNSNNNNDQGGSRSNNNIFIYSPKEVVVDNSQWNNSNINNDNNNNGINGNNKKGNINNRLHGRTSKRNRQNINNNNNSSNKDNDVSNSHNNSGIQSTNSNTVNARRDHDIQSTTTNTNTDITTTTTNNNLRSVTMFTNKDNHSLSRTNSTIENFKTTASKITIPKLFKKKPPIEPVIHQSASLIPYSSFENLSHSKDSHASNVNEVSGNIKDSDDDIVEGDHEDNDNINTRTPSQQHIVSVTNDVTAIQQTNSIVQSLNSHHHLTNNERNTIAAVDRISLESFKADNLTQPEQLGNILSKHGENLNSTALYNTTSILETNEESEDIDEGEEEDDEEDDESDIYIPVVDNTNNVIVLDQEFDDDEDD
ncbi:unnamed protein product [[Candida] boidinii]|uniref:pH-response regulator protein palH/RIM21 n=1 Tax=Candida boidinii TaxID=5477 RepID=A0A9W6SUA8_CANBO|nr:unnamed protein product [[Candida] boidinii]